MTQPLSPYLLFEFSQYYAPHALAGEKIRILDVSDRANPLEGVQDFWIFDSAEVVLMNYDPEGRQINREVHSGAAAQRRSSPSTSASRSRNRCPSRST